MAHTPTSLTNFDELLKDVIQPMIIQTKPERSAFRNRLQTLIPTNAYGGRYFELRTRYDNMGSTAALAEGDALPVAYNGTWDAMRIPFSYQYGSVSVYGPAIARSSSDLYANADALAESILVMTRSFNQHINRQLCGDGNGILCQMDGDDNGSGALTVDNAGGWSGYNASAVNGDKYLTTGMYIQSRDSGGTVENAGLLITAITPGAFPSTSAILTVTGTSTSVDDGSYLYRAASATASNDSYGHEMAGVKLLIDDNTVAATVQSISATDYTEWRSQVGYGSTPGTAEALTTDRMNILLSEQQMRGGGSLDFIACSQGVWLTYGKLGDQSASIMAPSRSAASFDSAYPTLNFNGVDVFPELYMADEMYFIDTSTLALYQAMEQGWIDYGGQSIRQVAGYDQMEANWRWYVNLGITNRAKNAKMTDISVTANVK